MEFLTDPQVWLAFLTLTVLEIVLGIDNIIFISVLTGRLPEAQRARGRFFGLALAMLMRIALLLSLTWVMKLTDDLFTVLDQAISGRDLILILGGAFLIGEIHAGSAQLARRDGGRAQRGGHGDVRQRAAADRPHRHRVLARFGDHRGRPGAARRGDDRGDRDLGADHDDRGRLDQPLRRRPSDDQDAGAVVPAADRRHVDRGRASTCTFRRATSTSRWRSRSASRC